VRLSSGFADPFGLRFVEGVGVWAVALPDAVL
jgi:hypothetical protein